jgi:hypothetical protein
MTEFPLPPHNPTTREDWQAWVDHDLRFAEMALKKHGEFIQMVIIHRSDDRLVRMLCPFTSEMQRVAVLKFLRVCCVAHSAVGVAVIGEVWVNRGDISAEEAKLVDIGLGLLPSQRLDRQEGIAVTMFYRENETRQGIGDVHRILRDAENTVIGIEPMFLKSTDPEDGPDADVGVIAEILSPATPALDRVKNAQDYLSELGEATMNILGIHE